MQATIDTFEERNQEIDLYFNAIVQLYDSRDGNAYLFCSDDFLKILKSNAILMIYNLVESTIMGGIQEIYEDLQVHGITYRQVRKEIQDIWFSFKFNQVYDKKAHYHSYRDKAAEIINMILDDGTLILDKSATALSGNLDAEQIRKICFDHGIQFTLDKKCRGGVVLSEVRCKRNDLAHGTMSFVECGRNYSIDDLERIKIEAVLYLKAILDGMKVYYDSKLYLKEPPL